MKLTFLGTGTSFGVPQVGCHCEVCRSTDPRDKRSRVGAVIETAAGLRLLIDTPPELRLQLIANNIDTVDAVLYTHEHADHLHGIDDLRAITIRRDTPLPLYGSSETLAVIAARFPYIVDSNMKPPPGTTKPNGRLVTVEAGVPFEIKGVTIIPVNVPHGNMTVMGYRVGDIAYITDAKSIDGDARAALKGVRILVLNALLRRPHPTHLSIAEAVKTAREIGAEQTFFTHLTHENFHADLEAELPDGISPAFDGLTIQLNERQPK